MSPGHPPAPDADGHEADERDSGEFDVLCRLFDQDRVCHDFSPFHFDLRPQTLPGLRADPDGALGGATGWCAVYRSMDLHYIHLSINKLLMFFCNNPGRLGKGKLPFGNILPAFEKSGVNYSRTVIGKGQPWDKGQDSIQDRETLCPLLLAGRKHTSDVSESSENSLFWGFVCFRREALSATTIYAVKSSTVSARKSSVNSDTSETLKNGYHVGFEPETSDAGLEKIPDFFKKQGPICTPAWR